MDNNPTRNSNLMRGEKSAEASAWKPSDISGSVAKAAHSQDPRMDAEFLSPIEHTSLIPAAETASAQAWQPIAAGKKPVARPLIPLTGRSGVLSAVSGKINLQESEQPIKRILKKLNADAESQPMWKPTEIPAQKAGGGRAASRMLLHAPELARQAQEDLQKAREEAERILKEAKAQADAVTLKAKDDGRQAALDETRATLEAAAALFREASDWRAKMVKNSEEIVLDMVRDIAKAMFGQGVGLEPEALRKVFERAMAEARAIGNLRIHVHPDDAMALGSEWWQQQQAGLGGMHIELVASETVKRGGCFIEGEFGSVDARVETQLTTILRTLGETES